MGFSAGFTKIAKGFRFGGYAMDLFKASKKLPATPPIKKVTNVAADAAKASAGKISKTVLPETPTFKNVTTRPFTYNEM